MLRYVEYVIFYVSTHNRPICECDTGICTTCYIHKMHKTFWDSAASQFPTFGKKQCHLWSALIKHQYSLIRRYLFIQNAV